MSIAYTVPTLADLKQSLADRKTGGTLPTDSSTLSLWIRTFNRGVRYCIEKLRIQKSTTLTVSSGVATLPDDFVIANQVVNSNDEPLDLLSAQDSDGVVGNYYWITGNMSDGFTFNTPTDGNYTLYYSYRPYKMAVDADVCPFPDEEAVISYAYAMLRRSESDPFEDFSISLAECDNRLREIESQFLMNDGGNQFSLQQNA
jgi:hypothetical protein